MKQLSLTQLTLLKELADGECHSGNALGERLSISRTAVWKHVRQLLEWGLPIQRIPQQGYQLNTPISFLDERTIIKHLHLRNFETPLQFHIQPIIGSTNQFLKELTGDSTLSICCAEMQTAGRGRFGRQWISPFAENIYFSSRWQLDCCLSQLSGLSLLVGLAVLAALKDSGIDETIQLKWPNDLIWSHKKLCGILIEVIAESNGCAQVIIGIGLNVNTETDKLPIPDKPWCSLYEITGKRQDRNHLLANLIYQLHQHMREFLNSGFASFLSDWQTVDYLAGKLITVSQPNGLLQGKALGVNQFGQLCLQDEAGVCHELSSGDTSVNTIEH
ncbi:bifunctional biotin--[acetyl-CoA-carboxylase] ligase/biotin operon repressor BirA [Legionella jordanis]|uniref:Bifunctional ligase/repressor BirA n=1 Tax=Legionella jordanis TaxID=456 RepID=A0A0W0VFR2_9GAMM|nr:bifunctional biotin--[acetyl-CoA-carboxylase] ligase/biotin operon repressor BirA [Legionella jordanis]KTD18945.1 biotin-[acetylCoA carboxylase] holoenzyme synthetase and biotin operon repressor [Legionella jordanis]RMX05491.1 bifunctional biotin--[acetyl-CoA-carboxylase] ligase/biotin operon repressor BirA [Legionella jordanis]RMX19176.1 bifunctional biotin--[acetyl-CoA-carboxylase] ligase/biotin operon repressor BirA [Legionella jordanis]VEH13045.1 biotin-[acetylCoA carboxylase] holoenzyme